MSTEFGDKLQNALDNSNAIINTYIWKGPKANGSREQEVIRLMDATQEQLQGFYNHCRTMLYNTDRKNLGRVPLLKEIEQMRDRCGVELFFRESEKTQKDTRFGIVSALRASLKRSEASSTLRPEDVKLGDIIAIGPHYEKLPVDLIIEGGLDKLGRFDATQITVSFIVRQGVWLIKGEKKEYISLPHQEKIAKIKSDLKLKPDYRLKLDPITGLSLTDMKTALSIRTRKYSDLDTEQLRLLRYKLLFALEDQVNFHISEWKGRMNAILEVAEKRGITIIK